MFVIAPGWQEDSNDLSATLMEAWAGGEWSTDVFCPFQQNLFFYDPAPFTRFYFVIQQFARLTYNYEFLAAGAGLVLILC